MTPDQGLALASAVIAIAAFALARWLPDPAALDDNTHATATPHEAEALRRKSNGLRTARTVSAATGTVTATALLIWLLTNFVTK